MSFRNNSTGFNDSPDEKSSEIRIACTMFNMNRDISTIAPTMNGMKANKVIITSHFIFLDNYPAIKEEDRVSTDQ